MLEAAIALILLLIVIVGVGKVLVAVIGGGLRAGGFFRGAWEGAKDNWVALALAGGALLLVLGPVAYALVVDALERRTTKRE